VITLQVHPPGGGCPIAIPANVRVHRKHDPVTTIGHAAAMIHQDRRLVASPILLRGRERRLHPAGQPGAGQAGSGEAGVRRNAALFAAKPPPSQDLPARSWATVEADVRGATVTRLVHVRDVLWYTTNKIDLVWLVNVGDPDGAQPDDYFFSTDLHTIAAEVIVRYADSWAIEVCFCDTKQDLGRTPNRGSARDPNAPQPCRSGCTSPPGAGTLNPTAPDKLGHHGLVPDQDHVQLSRRPRRAPPNPVVTTNCDHVTSHLDFRALSAAWRLGVMQSGWACRSLLLGLRAQAGDLELVGVAT
jgi:hypothetical protein